MVSVRWFVRGSHYLPLVSQVHLHADGDGSCFSFPFICLISSVALYVSVASTLKPAKWSTSSPSSPGGRIQINPPMPITISPNNNSPPPTSTICQGASTSSQPLCRCHQQDRGCLHRITCRCTGSSFSCTCRTNRTRQFRE